MKKPIAMMAVLSTAAVMAAVTPSFLPSADAARVLAAAAGWVDENGSWRYLDSDGYYLTDTWKKKDNEMYYLDEEGEIATDMIINDEYYVDETGKRMSNHWISVYNEEDNDSPDSPEYYWYYFGRDSRMVRSKWHKIDSNWYYFNSDGQMLTGMQEIDGSIYYLGEENDGVRKTGWVHMEEDHSEPDSSDVWYFFDNNGRRVENQVDRKIDQNYYTFVDGRMQTGWVKLPASAEASAADAKLDDDIFGSNQETAEPKEGSVIGYQYYEENGKRASGWYEIEGAQGISEEGETYRFYFRSGKPLAASNGIQTFNVDNKKYAFNEKGEMQTGLQVITLADGQIANAYFGDDGVMRTGKQTIYNEDSGETETWYFHTDNERKGQGFHGIRDNVIYHYGLRQSAPSDLRYAPVEFEGNTYLVNTSGAIQKASSSSKSDVKPELGAGFKDVTDENADVWVVDTNGIIQK
ncbi:MAG: cell wall-binding protein [Lachnospiraceae bacterium]|nr:cell wall-binding protein [Lachnospiraceae bacterium]